MWVAPNHKQAFAVLAPPNGRDELLLGGCCEPMRSRAAPKERAILLRTTMPFPTRGGPMANFVGGKVIGWRKSYVKRALSGGSFCIIGWMRLKEIRRTAEYIIHEAVDDVIADSAEQYLEKQEKSVSHLNSQLADAVAELRQQTSGGRRSEQSQGQVSGDAESRISDTSLAQPPRSSNLTSC
jgi:hypothetical protein